MAHDVFVGEQTGKHLLRAQTVSERNQKQILCRQQMSRAGANRETLCPP